MFDNTTDTFYDQHGREFESAVVTLNRQPGERSVLTHDRTGYLSPVGFTPPWLLPPQQRAVAFVPPPPQQTRPPAMRRSLGQWTEMPQGEKSPGAQMPAVTHTRPLWQQPLQAAQQAGASRQLGGD
jgi:hypothetical protein